MRLFSYKMAHDSGFAPNPFWGTLTLANCKPRIREKKREEDWIAGFTSQTLCPSDRVGQERLVYLAQISGKIPFAEYYRDPAFACKKPGKRTARERCGDNIYRPRRPGAYLPRDFIQEENDNHFDNAGLCVIGDSRRTDISGRYVLTSEHFVYFGSKALVIPTRMRPSIPRGQSANGALTHEPAQAQRFIDFVFAAAGGKRIVGPPTGWPEEDDRSWLER